VASIFLLKVNEPTDSGKLLGIGKSKPVKAPQAPIGRHTDILGWPLHLQLPHRRSTISWPRNQQQFFPVQTNIHFEVRQFIANSPSPQTSALQQSWVTERVIGNVSTPYAFWL
jgi:hypothetical protein